MIEIRPVQEEGFEHYYVDNVGNVYNSRNTQGVPLKVYKKLKSFSNKNTKYSQVVLRNAFEGRKPKAFYVHRLVAKAWIPNPENHLEINHKNMERSDNRVENLEWCTRLFNMRHAFSMKGPFPRTQPVKERIQKDIQLLQKGIESYTNERDMNKLMELWECSDSTARKILISNGFSFLKNVRVPLEILKEIVEDISKLPNPMKPPQGWNPMMVEKYKTKWNYKVDWFKLERLRKKYIQGTFSGIS